MELDVIAAVVVGISPFVQRIIIGLIIIMAVLVDQLRRRFLEKRVMKKQ